MLQCACMTYFREDIIDQYIVYMISRQQIRNSGKDIIPKKLEKDEHRDWIKDLDSQTNQGHVLWGTLQYPYCSMISSWNFHTKREVYVCD